MPAKRPFPFPGLGTAKPEDASDAATETSASGLASRNSTTKFSCAHDGQTQSIKITSTDHELTITIGGQSYRIGSSDEADAITREISAWSRHRFSVERDVRNRRAV